MDKSDIHQSDVAVDTPQKHPCLSWFKGSCPFAQYFPEQKCPLANVPRDACEWHVRSGECEYGSDCVNAHDAKVNGRNVDLHAYFLDQWSDKTHPCHLNHPSEPCPHTPCHLTELPATTCVRHAVGSGCTDAVCPRGFLHVDADGHDLRERFLAQQAQQPPLPQLSPPPHLCTVLGMPCDLGDDGACVYRHICESGVDMSNMPDDASENGGAADIREQYVVHLRMTEHPCHVWFGSCKYGDTRCVLRDFTGDSCYDEVFNPDGCPNMDCPLVHVHAPIARTLRAVYQLRTGYTKDNETVTRVIELPFDSPPCSEQPFLSEKRPPPPPYDDVERRNKEVVDPYFEDTMSPEEMPACGNVDQMLAMVKAVEAKHKQARRDIDAFNDAAQEQDDCYDEANHDRWVTMNMLIRARQRTWARKRQLEKAIRLCLLPQRWAEMQEAFKRGTATDTPLPVDLHLFGVSYLCDIVKRLLLYSATLPDKNVLHQNLCIHTGSGEVDGIETAKLFRRLLDILENDKWMATFISKKTIHPDECKVDVTLDLSKLRRAYTIPSQSGGHNAELVSLQSVKRKPSFDAVCEE